jgi:outer membrane protein
LKKKGEVLMRQLLVVILGVMFLFGSTSNISAKEEGKKIGYVDLSRVFDQYQKTIDYDKELEKKGDKKQSEREKKVSEIKRLKEELELLSEKGKKEKQDEIDRKIKELQDFDLATRTDLKRERARVVREILKEIDKVVQEYGKNKGYFLILNDRVLLYGDEQFDLTDEIIKILNEKYKK